MPPRRSNPRLFCLVANPDMARAVVKTLQQAQLEPPAVRVIARRETLLVDLPEASLRERSGIVEAAKRGVLMGSVGGVITGIVAAIELTVPTLFACALVVGGGIAGSAFGAWASAMMGIEEPHSTIRPYQQAIESGQVLVLVDVERDQVSAIKNLIRRQHPAARIDAENTTD